jgi:hypothetical protein
MHIDDLQLKRILPDLMQLLVLQYKPSIWKEMDALSKKSLL